MEKKKKLRMPHAYTLIFMLIILVAIMTWIIPSGEFEREVVSTATGERTVAVAGTYHTVEKVLEDGTDLHQGISAVLQAPGSGRSFGVCIYCWWSISDHGKDKCSESGDTKSCKKTWEERYFNHSNFDGFVWFGWKYFWNVG